MASSLGSCIICYSGFRLKKIAALPCGHTFHYDCVLQWVQTSKTCPSCRKRCVESTIIKTLFFNTDHDSTVAVAAAEDELDSVKKELFEKKKECTEMEKKLKSAQSEASVNLKERAKWQKRAEEGAEATKKVAQLKAMMVDQNEKEREIHDLRTKLKASKFYQLIVSGGSEENLNKYVKSDGEVDSGHFLAVLRKQLKDANDKLTEEKKKRVETEQSISNYKRLVQELRKDSNEDLTERLDKLSKEKRISFGGETSRLEFSDSFLGSAMRPAPKGRINIGRKEEVEECNTVLDIPSASRRPFRPSPEKDAFDVVMPKKVRDRIGHSEKMSNGMGSAFSMKNSFDRLSALPIFEKENRPKPYERAVPKKKILSNNGRLSSFFHKQKIESKSIDLNGTICID
ncbi:hypothetical protein PMAYCL1PPCAC_06849 [Pristionchus mayeri]|uniref:RING-type domain-containing protein n=1 Tax=Pristionchus mayeri TaxID=1317129 RepID=A0AAN4ZB04_9BILA|nr:hypothetical protein PMAYCL1PPCAC_06849 [Pristionchus mayeri]